MDLVVEIKIIRVKKAILASAMSQVISQKE